MHTPRMRNALVVFGLFVVLSGQVSAQDVERVLVPIHEPLPVPGAFGSEWVSDFRIYNASDEIVLTENFGEGCQFEPCSPGGVPARTTISGAFIWGVYLGDWNQGAVLNVRKPGVNDLVFQLRVRDISRSAEGWGTWVPVVRESALTAGPVHLLNVPVEDGHRITLRVYSFREAGRVTVRIFGTDGGLFAPPAPDPLLGEFSLDIRRGGGSEPGYAQFGDLADLAQNKGFRFVRLEIIPHNDLRVWAMASVTNNVTQQVTGVYPND